jgi:hypothetical protein
MSTAVLWNFCVTDIDIRYRSVGEWNIVIHRSPLMAIHLDLFLLISARQTSVSDRCACARLIAGRTTYRPLKRDYVWSLEGGSATWRCALWNDQRTGHLLISTSLSHTQISGTVSCHLSCLAVPKRIFLLWFIKRPCFDWRLTGHTPPAVWAREPLRIICTVKNLLSLPGLEPCSLVSIPT